MTESANKLLRIARDEYSKRIAAGIPKQSAMQFLKGDENLCGLFSDWSGKDFATDLCELRDAGYVKYYIRGGFELLTKAVGSAENTEPAAVPSAVMNNFNFDNTTINNSVVGSQSNVTQNVGTSLDDLEKLIPTKSPADQAVLNEMLDVLKEIRSSNKPVEKGQLSRFADFIDNFSDIGGAVAKFLLCIFTKQ